MGKKFSDKFKSLMSKQDWGNLCLPNQYKVLSSKEAKTLGIIPETINNPYKVVVGASGSLDDTITYFANCFRIDNQSIDQEPHIEIFISGSNDCQFQMTFHHGNYSGRTKSLTSYQINLLKASGSNVDIGFKELPSNDTGSLFDLRNENKINGFDYSFSKAHKMRDD